MNKLKYILTLIIGLIILTPGVQAECTNLLPEGEMQWYSNSNGYYISFDGQSLFLNSILNVDTTYTFYATKDGVLVESLIPSGVNFFDIKSAKDVIPTNSYAYGPTDVDLSHFIFTPSSTSINILYSLPIPAEALEEMSTWQFWIVEGSEVCLNSTETEEPETPVDPETPTDPDEPTIEETDQGVLLSNFYSIYIEKLSSISNFAIENKFVLSAITIILLLVCLDLFLYLFKGGGHK